MFINQKVYNYTMLMEVENDTSDMIRELCDRMNISLAELCRRIGQTPQNFNKKLQRGTVSSEEMSKIAEVLDVGYEQAFCVAEWRENRKNAIEEY